MRKFLRKKTNRYILVAVVCLLCLGAIGFFVYKGYQEVKDIGTGTKTTIKDNEMYSINSNATDYQKELYKQLSEAVNNTPEGTYNTDIADLVAKSFVADFFTWTNKQGSYDVGGLEYVYTDQIETIAIGARETFYKYLSYYFNQYGSTDGLLQVKNVTTTVYPGINITMGGVDFPMYYYIVADWEYEPSTNIDSSQFQTNAIIDIVVNNGRYEIVNFYYSE